MLFFRSTALMVTLISALSGCVEEDLLGSRSSGTINPDLTGATKVELWATRYYLYEAAERTASDAIPLRGLSNEVVGPALSQKDWCNAAIEGSVRVAGQTYNFAGVSNPRQASCSAHRPSERVRWRATSFEFGVGNANNPLVPFKTVACDQGTVSNSSSWLNGGFARFGQEIYVPAAKGTELPDGSVHNGIFTCGDTGGLIVGNHIDVFLGGAAGASDAAASDPFSFIRSTPTGTFEAYVLN